MVKKIYFCRNCANSFIGRSLRYCIFCGGMLEKIEEVDVKRITQYTKIGWDYILHKKARVDNRGRYVKAI